MATPAPVLTSAGCAALVRLHEDEVPLAEIANRWMALREPKPRLS